MAASGKRGDGFRELSSHKNTTPGPKTHKQAQTVEKGETATTQSEVAALTAVVWRVTSPRIGLLCLRANTLASRVSGGRVGRCGWS